MKLRLPARRDTLHEDAVAGLVLGVESVPDGLAAGLLAGVNPLAGLYGYLFGAIGGADGSVLAETRYRSICGSSGALPRTRPEGFLPLVLLCHFIPLGR